MSTNRAPGRTELGFLRVWALAGVGFATIGLGWTFVADSKATDAANKVTVSVYMSTDCPVAMRTAPRLAQLETEWEAKGVEFTAYFPNEGETQRRVADYMRDRKLDFPFRLDVGGSKAKSSGVEIVPTVVVRRGDTVLYRGPMDDAKVTEEVKTHYLKDALTAALDGKEPKIKEAEAFGCYLMAGDPIPSMEEVNYAEHTAAIINDNCLVCHRPGEVAPFSLEGYDNARKWSRMIAKVSSERRMPPWLAVEGVGEFSHEMRLTEREIATLAQWAEAGAPSGDLSKAPKAPEFPVGWRLGEPDMLISMPKPFKLGDDGRDEIWNFVIKPDITEPVYVQALDVKPGNKSVVHHVAAFIDEKGASERLLEGGRDGGYQTFGGPGFAPDNMLGAWLPGLQPVRMPEGTGFLLKPGARIVMQVHYSKTGREEVDQSKMALYFSKEPVTKPTQMSWFVNPGIVIPPGDPRVEFKRVHTMPKDVTLYSLMAHMHLLGKEMHATLIHPDGTRERLLSIDKWDFNWQLNYMLKEPKLIKRGSKIEIVAVFDNSEDNPSNPSSPPREVRWGEETTDEMMVLLLGLHMHP